MAHAAVLFGRRFRALLILAILTALLPAAPTRANPFPPVWGGGAVHFPPAAWPADNAWIPYTSQSDSINDPRISDPSNGGTSPQNHVNVSSSCIDETLPSVYYQYDPSTQTIFYRWRVETIANTYATGPNAGAYAGTDPWQSGLWTVLIDIDGDGFREFAAHLNGSSGAPSAQIDLLAGIYSDTPNQSIDYIGDPANIHLLEHNPTAFVDTNSGRLLNFQSSLNPTTTWPNGSAETVWDYGTTRSTQLIKTSSCAEYMVDYQIPLGMLDASSVGGPTVTPDTPLSFLFATANSLNNPLQKDAVLNGDFIADPSKPAPFGDVITLNGGVAPQPIVQSVSASGCGPVTLTAQVNDALTINGGVPATSVTSVDFYALFDANANGQADGGETWVFAAAGATSNNPLGRWTASWNTTALPRGQYLIGVKATDAQGNITWSHLTQAQVGASPPNYANPATPGVVFTSFLNSCGLPPPSISKAANPSQVLAGQQTQFTITVTNPSANALTVSQIEDILPDGFSHLATVGGTLGTPTSAPANGATGTIAWTFSPAASVPGGQSRTLIFNARASSVVGAYTNVATGATSAGTLTSDPIAIGVGAPRLTIQKRADRVSASPGDPIVYTITYANDSPISVSGAIVSDTLPLGLTFVSASNGGVYDGATRAIRWNVGAIASGDGPFSVSFSATVDSPYPDAAEIPLVNTATIDSTESDPASASAATFIDAPRPALSIQKDAATSLVAPNGVATFTLSYANTGNATASGVVITDSIPAGFSFVSASNGGTNAGSLVTWNIGNVAAGTGGSVQVSLRAASSFSAANPAINVATIDSTQTAPLSDSFAIGVTQSGQVCNTYYFHDETTNVGAGPDGGVRRIANTIAPAPGVTGTGTLITVPLNQVYVEALRFYQDPVSSGDVTFAGTLTTTIYIDRQNGPGITIRGSVYDYDSVTGNKMLLGTNTTSFNGSQKGAFTFGTPMSGTLERGHRLLWIFEAKSDVNNQTANLLFQYDGIVANSVSGSGTTNADSRASFCVAPPANLLIDKQVDELLAQPGDTLRYSIRFANIGQSAASGAQVVETLPEGVAFTGAALNGVPTAPASVVGRQLTFNVNSRDTAILGRVTGGVSGTLELSVTVDLQLAEGIASLQNIAAVQSDQTAPVSDTATTTLLRPDVSIAKEADRTLLIAGDTLTYTLTVLNTGLGAASDVTIRDTLPVTDYFSYVPGSAELNGTPLLPDPVSGNTLVATIGALAPGDAATLTFQMRVAASGVPPGATTLTNTAVVSDAATIGSRSSNPALVTISANPNLRIVKAASPAGPVEAGAEVTYTLSLSNIGGGDALGTLVLDAIPANTRFVAGSLTYAGAPQSDAEDGDVAHFDAATNRVVYRVGALPAGASRALTFRVRVNTPLTAGATAIGNTAVASASNAAAKQDSASFQATAAPALSLAKSGPASVPFPLTTLASPATAATTIIVASAAAIAVGDVVSINGAIAAVTGVNGAQITLSAPVSGAAGSAVLPTYEYVLAYANTGNASATSVVVSDTLPVGLSFISASAPGAYNAANRTVSWNLGTLGVGQSGLLRVRVRPDVAGSFDNAATIASAQTSATSNEVTTRAGTLLLTKSTATPTVSNTPDGAQATYTITLSNQLASPVSGVVVTDTLAAGFSYAGPSTFGGNAVRTSVQNPSAGASQPVWGAWSIPAGGTLTISFVAAINASVGAATYQNEVAASAAGAVVTPFDALGTNADDVTVQIATVGGTVFDDANGNGTREVGEEGIAGVTVRLFGPGPDGLLGTNDDLLVGTTTTATDGSYRFDGIAPGRYLAVETDPSGYVSTTPNSVPIVVAPGGASSASFGDQRAGTVVGAVFNDLNGNGQQDGGEAGIANVSIQLIGMGPDQIPGTGDDLAPRAATTASDGTYTFEAVAPGNYLVIETDPPGYVSTTSNTVAVFVAAGGAASASFGDQRQGTVAGVVFEDRDADGNQGAGEAGIAGVTVRLYSAGPDDLLGTGDDVLVQTATTDSAGAYRFENVSAGSYLVRETDPAGYVSTTPNAVPISLAAGGAATASFGDQPIGSVSGSVFNDLNGDGRRDVGEGGIPGVTVRLYGPGPDGLLGTGDDVVLQVATTGDDGSYSFGSVPAGNYAVRETNPAGYISTTPDLVLISVAPGGAGSASFGDQPIGSVSGRVFADMNGNGRQDAGEDGIGGVSVRLFDANNTLVGTATTAGDGSYSFSGIPSGAYTVVETDPPGYVSTTSNSVALFVAPGGAGSANFGDQPIGTVGGTVYRDLNGNGQQDVGESGIGGVRITLRDSNGNQVATTTTAGDGSYLFLGVVPGSYVVEETDPEGYVSTTSNRVPISVAPGGAESASFGDQPVGSVSGRVFADMNGNGQQDTGEEGIGGVVVRLLDVGNTEVATATTTADGSYSFNGVTAGIYTVAETDPPGYVSTTPNSVQVIVAPGGAGAANFGDQPIGSVSGAVFNDLNGNGRQDAGEDGIGGVTVTLLTSGQTPIASAITAGDGSYVFAGVVPGSYLVVETDPPGFVSTTPNSVPIEVASGGAASANFGDQPVGTIAGRVYYDLNGNGQEDAGEEGIGGVLVTLRDSQNNLVQTATTASDGSYTFGGVAAGNYTVVETDPPGFVSTTPNSVAVALGSGDAASVSFGDRQVGTLGGVVYHDLNTSAARDAGEPGLGGVTLRIYTPGRDNIPGTPDDILWETLTTASDGSYLLAGLAPGTYTVVESDLAGFVSTTPNSVTVILPANGVGQANFGDRLSPTAISLLSFTATPRDGAIEVRWVTAAEINTWGFHLLRSSDGTRASAVRVTAQLIPHQGRGQSGATYSWTDTNIEPGIIYTYWLQEIEITSAINEYGPARAVWQPATMDNQIFIPLIAR